MTAVEQGTATLHTLALDELSTHPGNPRLTVREDVVDQITAEIARRGFGPQYAVEVRPHGDGYQIVAGHHRVAAAGRAGLTEIPAWVEEMDDDEAFMRLVTSNAQGELSPLEIGVHALHAVKEGKRGRGNRGDGLTAYAERVGRSQPFVSQMRAAAGVYTEIHKLTNEFPPELIDKATHLYEISRAPRDEWSGLVAALVEHGWTVAVVKERVGRLAEAARQKLADAERLIAEEAAAEQFIRDTAPDLAEQVGGHGLFQTFVEARDVWNRRNKEEAKRLHDEAESERKREAAERSARSDLYTGIARGLQIIGGYGHYEDIPKLMELYDPAELYPPQYEKEFELDNLRCAATFVAELIKWREAR